MSHVLFAAMLLTAPIYEDVVHLNDGSIIRGIIIEHVPTESLIIQLRDGRQLVYNADEVIRVTKESVGSSKYTSRKNPGLATAMSFLVPGLGQFYNEQPGKGISFFLCNVISIALVINAADNATRPYYEESNIDTLGIIGLGGMFISWGSSMVDAYETAKEINTEFQLTSKASIRPIAAPSKFGAVVSVQF